MPDNQPAPLKDTVAKWASVIAMAMLTAYSAHPLLTILLQVADDLTQSIDKVFMPLMIGGLGAVFVVAALRLAPKVGVLLRIELGCRWSGILMWLTIPLMIAMVFIVSAQETGADQGGATAAFFMLLIFGGYYAIVGSVLLFASEVLRRRRVG